MPGINLYPAKANNDNVGNNVWIFPWVFNKIKIKIKSPPKAIISIKYFGICASILADDCDLA